LLRITTTPLPLQNRVDSNFNHSHQNTVFQSFLNAPNFISFARLVSGPFLGW
jgi:cardiolipin synthase